MVFREDLGYPNTKMELACGQCIGCRLDKARMWAVRCLHEASLYKENCFVTLTYANPPKDNSLNKRDMQLFLKRLRKAYPDAAIRYFQCGEYGERNGRPHHHLLLFNFNFPDRLLFRRINGNDLYLSKSLSQLWPHGLHSIGEITFDSACYTARYILKKVTGDPATEHYGNRLPEYTTMSRRPGIGKDWFSLYKEDLYNHDHCVVRHDFICRPPSYYDRLFDLSYPERFSRLKAKRKERAKNNPNNTEDRRETLKKLQTIKQSRLQRSYETQE